MAETEKWNEWNLGADNYIKMENHKQVNLHNTVYDKDDYYNNFKKENGRLS